MEWQPIADLPPTEPESYTGAPIGYLEIVSTGLYVEVVYGGAFLFDPQAQILIPATPHL